METIMKRDNKKRLQEITQIIKKHELVKKGLSPEKLRLLLEDLGPTFVKLGQIMSKRNDILPKNYCLELDKLCADSNPLPVLEIIEVIEEELGQSVDELFLKFDEKPLGSASIGQVHSATLKNGSRVVIKVQRPGVAEVMKEDMMILKRLTVPLKFAPSIEGPVDFHKLLDEFWTVSREELDFLVEAKNTKKFKENNAEINNMGCPTIYDEYTTSKVMTMEYIDGFSIGDVKRLDKEKYDRNIIGNQITENFIKQVIDDGFFHADPHQGNIMIRGDEIVWIDMGMVGTLSSSERMMIKGAIQAVIQKDNDAIIRSITALGAVKGEFDYTRLYSDIDLLLDKYYNMNLGEVNLSAVLEDMLRVVGENHIVLPAGISILARGMLTIEGVLHTIAPDTNIVEIAKKHMLLSLRTDHTILNKIGNCETSSQS